MGNCQHPSRQRRLPANSFFTISPNKKARWLHHAAEAMLQAVQEDWDVWKKKGYA
jgi:putative SOS response-associated peptidase YedK